MNYGTVFLMADDNTNSFNNSNVLPGYLPKAKPDKFNLKNALAEHLLLQYPVIGCRGQLYLDIRISPLFNSSAINHYFGWFSNSLAFIQKQLGPHKFNHS